MTIIEVSALSHSDLRKLGNNLEATHRRVPWTSRSAASTTGWSSTRCATSLRPSATTTGSRNALSTRGSDTPVTAPWLPSTTTLAMKTRSVSCAKCPFPVLTTPEPFLSMGSPSPPSIREIRMTKRTASLCTATIQMTAMLVAILAIGLGSVHADGHPPALARATFPLLNCEPSAMAERDKTGTTPLAFTIGVQQMPKKKAFAEHPTNSTERVRFELTLTTSAKLVFETSAFSRSATSPEG